MNKPRNFYDTADRWAEIFGDKPIERVEYVEKQVYSFSPETLRFAEQCAKEQESKS